MDAPRRAFSAVLTLLLTLASGAARAGGPITAKVAQDTITVRAEGLSPAERFLLVFTRQSAGISEWYDLDRDPAMRVNLAPHGDTTGYALFQNRIEMLSNAKPIALFPEAAKQFALVESNAVRAVVEIGGRMTTASGEFPGEKFRKEIKAFTGRRQRGPERPRYVTRFTVTATGRIYIRHVLKFKGQPMVLASTRMILATAPAKDVTALNEHPREIDAFIEPASFLLHHGGGDDFAASALLVSEAHKYRTDWIGQLVTVDRNRRGWVRSAFTLHAEPNLVQAGDVAWNFMLQLEPSNVDSRESAALYARDYRKPATITFVGGHGMRRIKELEDAQFDGFAEGRGAYVMSADGKPTVLMNFEAGTLSRFNPVFEIHDWKRALPERIHVDGEVRRRGVHYHAHLDGGRLMIQYLGALPPGAHMIRVDGEVAKTRLIR